MIMIKQEMGCKWKITFQPKPNMSVCRGNALSSSTVYIKVEKEIYTNKIQPKEIKTI